MLISPDILDCLRQGKEAVEEISLTYRNGGRVVGSIHKLRMKPLKLVIKKTEPKAGERPRHRMVADHVSKMEITMKDGRRLHFEDSQP